MRLPNASEQHVLNHLRVRLITEAERPRWNALVTAHHYLHNAILVGEHLCYMAESQGAWLALLGWSAPARHLRPREAWIGWAKDQRAARRHFLANNARFCIRADPDPLVFLDCQLVGEKIKAQPHCNVWMSLGRGRPLTPSPLVPPPR